MTNPPRAHATHPTRRQLWLACCLAAAALTGLVGCDDADGDTSSDVAVDTAESDVDPATDPTWSESVRPLVAEACTSCHYTGGAAPFAFETHEQVAAAAPAILAAMESGRMPPWPADPTCNTYVGERVLDPAQIAVFDAWLQAGTPEGDATEPIEVTPTAFEATHTVRAAEPYTPDFATEGDDYRCFLLDVDFAEPMWVTGTNVAPATEAVHHVLVYGLTGEQVADAEAFDAADETEGYPCFGGPLPAGEGSGMVGGVLQTVQVAGWVPGAEPNVLDDDTGIPVPAGARLVMQVHYSAAGGTPAPDHSALQLQMTTEAPAFELRTVPMAVPDLDIPAGESSVSFTTEIGNWSDETATITSFTGHMHLLGTSIETVKVGADGTETCGLAIDDWDFDWQLAYELPDGAAMQLAPGEAMRLACTYDNSAANQPVIDGVQQDPRDVAWGDGSLDEMCLMYATVVAPTDTTTSAPDDAACASATECWAASDGSLSALLACENVSTGCVACALQAGVGCGLAPCAISLSNARDCVASCFLAVNAFGGSLDRCMSATCGDVYGDLLECADPIVQSGACDEALATSCGLGDGNP